MAVRALDRAVLMGDAVIVARRHHPVVSDEVLITPRQILLRVAIEIAEGG
jgi:hypothetical protein